MIPWYHTAVHPDAQEQAFHPSLLPRKSYGQPPAEVPANTILILFCNKKMG